LIDGGAKPAVGGVDDTFDAGPNPLRDGHGFVIAGVVDEDHVGGVS